MTRLGADIVDGRGGAPHYATPHYATVAPGYDYDKNTGCMVANVGKENGIKRERGKDGAEKFQNYIIQHISEWSDKIDWKEAFEKATGVSNNGLTVFLRGENFEENIDNYITKIYTPYKWFNTECIAAMNTESSLFNKGYATFYHPVRFIKWLNEYRK